MAEHDELIARARKAILPWDQELCVEVVAALTEADADAREWENAVTFAEGSAENMRLERDALQAKLDAMKALAAEHWDWKAGRVLADRLRAILNGEEPK